VVATLLFRQDHATFTSVARMPKHDRTPFLQFTDKATNLFLVTLFLIGGTFSCSPYLIRLLSDNLIETHHRQNILQQI
jgi:hypothetical protein